MNHCTGLEMLELGIEYSLKSQCVGNLWIYFPSHEMKIVLICLFQDTSGSNWWLVFNNKTNIGYWPSSLFIYLFGAATTVFWGGEVYSQRLGTPHTLTAMGSGNFAGYRFGRSCYMSQIRIRDNSLVWKYPEWVSTYQSQYNCYDVLNDKEYSADPFFYFGGPGRNDRCP